MSLLIIDGSQGEGGGQIVRSALGMSLATSRPFKLTKIRSGRKRSGLLRQHLTAVEAARALSGATVKGAELGSTEIVFRPGQVTGGEYHFAVGTAGSALLVLQAILPGLLTAEGPCQVVLEGGTHNPWAPPFEFIERTFLPLLRRMGAGVEIELEKYGFYPAGGGRLVVKVEPCLSLAPLELLQRGPLTAKRAVALVANLPLEIARRELADVARKLDFSEDQLEAVKVAGSLGPGNVVLLFFEHGDLCEVFAGFGKVGVSSRAVVKEPIERARRYLLSTAPVGEYLADQILVPMALAGGGAFRTNSISRHTETNVEVLKQFVDLDVRVTKEDRNQFLVEMSGTNVGKDS